MTPKPPPPPAATLSDDQLVHHLRAASRLEDAPESLIQRALGLLPAAAPAPLPSWSELGAGLRRVLAALVLDTAGAPAPALGLRSGAASVRQLLFSAEGRDIDLRVTPVAAGAGRWMLVGQVLGPDLAGRVLLCAVPTYPLPPGEVPDQHAAVLTDLAEFRFGPVPAGRWQLVLLTEDMVLELPAFDVPAAG
jgi:hypothetical protein